MRKWWSFILFLVVLFISFSSATNGSSIRSDFTIAGCSIDNSAGEKINLPANSCSGNGFYYCDSSSQVSIDANPNGAAFNIAGLTNLAGNVMGMMPHPERAAFLKQVPFWISGPWGQKKQALASSSFYQEGPWEKLFVSLKDYLS